MKITADPARCADHGMCEALLPNVFQVDDTGVVRVAVEQVPDGDIADVRLAVDSCPVAALRAEDN
jgi:ferredoxin